MRVKITTTIDEELLAKAKEIVKSEGLDGANAVIEKALKLYFSDTEEVWEKTLQSGWVKKVVIQKDKVYFETSNAEETFQITNQTNIPKSPY